MLIRKQPFGRSIAQNRGKYGIEFIKGLAKNTPFKLALFNTLMSRD